MNVLDLKVQGESRNGVRARFYPIGDPHIDVKVADNRKLKKYIEFIARDKHAFALCVGDIFNASLPGHKYFSSKALKGDIAQHTDDYVNVMLERAVPLFQPLADAGIPLVMMRGNHDKWLKGVDIIKLLCSQYSNTVKYGGGEALIRVKVGRATEDDGNVWTVYAAHGAGGGYTPGGKHTRYANTAAHIADADIFVRGHVHDGSVRIVNRNLLPKSGRIALLHRPVAYITTPSFNSERVEGVVDYAGDQSLPPIDSGVQFLEIINPRSRGEGDSRNHTGRLIRHEWEY